MSQENHSLHAVRAGSSRERPTGVVNGSNGSNGPRAPVRAPGPMIGSGGGRSGTVERTIAREIVQLCKARIGRGPTFARANCEATLVTVLLSDALTIQERTLLDLGRAELVLEMRHHLYEGLREEAIEIVEVAADRPVAACTIGHSVEPDLAVCSFILASGDEPVADPAPGDEAERPSIPPGPPS